MLAVLLILAGLASLGIPVGVVGVISQSEFDPVELFFVLLALLYAWAAIGYSVAYLRKREVKRASSMATVAGFTVWALANARAVIYLEAVEERFGLFASTMLFFLPIVLGIGVTRYLKRVVRTKLSGAEHGAKGAEMRARVD